MFRINSVVKTSRKFNKALSFRKFSTPKALKEKLKGKVYIIDINKSSKCDENLSREVNMQKALRVMERKEWRDDQWKQLACIINEIFDKYKAQAVDKAKEMKIDELLVKMNKELKTKLSDPKLKELANKIQLKEIVDKSAEQWNLIKTSEGFAKVKTLPSSSVKIINDLNVKVQNHLVVFNESPYKQKIIHVVTIVVENIKKGSIELFKFIKDVYNAPGVPSKKQ